MSAPEQAALSITNQGADGTAIRAHAPAGFGIENGRGEELRALFSLRFLRLSDVVGRLSVFRNQ